MKPSCQAITSKLNIGYRYCPIGTKPPASASSRTALHAECVNLDPRTPVIVGAAQVTDRVDDPTDARTPLELMVDALESAAIDGGAPGCLADLNLLGVSGGLWSYTDPGRQVADRVGAADAATLVTAWSGHSPQFLLNHLAARIQAGDLEAAALMGGEVNASRRRARRLGVDIRRDAETGLAPAAQFGETLVMATPEEQARGVDAPVTVYPLLDSAIRHDRGETIDEHRRRLGDLWAGFNAVAVGNPHAAVRTPMNGEQITTPTDGNRLVGAPYTVAMNAHNSVDQASAVLLVSAARAEALGVPRDRWVFPVAGSSGLDTVWISERWELHRAPVLRLAGTAALEAAGIGVGDLAHLDLYSCFPSSVQLSTTELGIGDDRPLTVTGGLTFGGGPLNSYGLHAIARMTEVLREHPGELGLVSSNGGWLAKHAFGIYSTRPPQNGFQYENQQDQVDALPLRAALVDWDGPVTVERIQLEPQPANAPGEGTIQRWRFEERPEVLCASTPCVVDLPVGNVLLGFPTLGSEELVTRVLVHVSEEPTVYRRALDQYFPRRAGMLGVGVPSLLVGLGSASAGAALLPQGLDRDDRGRTIAGAVTLGVGVALFAIGYWLIKQGRHSLRPGASVHF